VISSLKYTLTKGMLWERLVIVKNRRTRRVLKVDSAECYVQAGVNKINIPVTITAEGGILLRLEPSETYELPEGELRFDIVAPVRDYTQVVAQGTINVSSLDTITPLGDASMEIPIKFAKGEDYYTSFIWKDGDGNTLTVTSAYMQAKNDAGQVVIDLRWFASPPNEAAIAALPGAQRGYLIPVSGNVMELHISDLNSVTAGTYAYDLFVQGTVNQWTRLVRGYVTIDPSVSVRP